MLTAFFVLIDFISCHFLRITVSVSDFVISITCIVSSDPTFMVGVFEPSSDDSAVVVEDAGIVVVVVIVDGVVDVVVVVVIVVDCAAL